MAKVKDEEQSSVSSSRARSSTYSHLGPGGTYLDFCTRSPEQYKQMREALLRLCTVRTDTARKVRFSATLGQEPEVELAERLHKDILSQALSYVSDIGEPSSVVITKR